jgi:hypothetical protein
MRRYSGRISQRNVEFLRRGFDLLGRGEAQAFLDYGDEITDATVELRAFGGLPDVEVVRGRDAARAWLTKLVSSEEFALDLEPEKFIDAGDAVIVPTRQTARGTEAAHALPTGCDHTAAGSPPLNHIP